MFLKNYFIPKYKILKFFENPKDTIDYYVKQNNLPILDILACNYNITVSSIKNHRNNMVKCYYYMEYISLDLLCKKAIKFNNTEILEFGLNALDRYNTLNNFDVLKLSLLKKLCKTAAIYNNKTALEIIKRNGYYNEAVIMKGAAYSGIIEILTKLEKPDYITIALYAARGNHFELTKWALNYTNAENQEIFILAAKFNNLDFIKENLHHDIPYNEILYISIINKSFALTNLIMNNFPYDINYLIKGISEIGLIDTLNQIENPNIYYVLKYAAKGGKMGIIEKYYNEKYLQVIVKEASKNSRREIVLWALNNGFNDYELISINAAKSGSLDILMIIEDEIKNFDNIAKIALENKKNQVVNWCLKKNINNKDELKNIAVMKANFYILNKLT